MGEQAVAGWYPDGRGNERYWDGSSWTEQLRHPGGTEGIGSEGSSSRKDGAFSRIGASIKKVKADKKAAKEELSRKQAQDAEAAGTLITSGVFGSSTVEIYAAGYVRIASWPANSAMSTPAPIKKDTPYERLRSIKFTRPTQDTSGGLSSALEGAVGPAMASLVKGGKNLMKTSAPGLAAAGLVHLAGAEGRKAFLTIATDKQIHTLTNLTSNGFIKSSNKGHNDVGLALEDAGNSVLRANGMTPQEPSSEAQPAIEARPASQPGAVMGNQANAGPTLAERMRELADLHKEGILSDEEFASAKAKLLGNL